MRAELKNQFVEALARLGGAAGNGRLAAELGWSEVQYAAVRDELAKAGEIARGRGRGGSVSLASRETSEPPVATQKSKANKPAKAKAQGRGGFDLIFPRKSGRG